MSRCEVDECWLYHSVKWTSVGCVTVSSGRVLVVSVKWTSVGCVAVSSGRVLVVSQCEVDECWLCRGVKWTSVGCITV